MDGKLTTVNSRSSFKALFSVLKGLHEANPLSISADKDSLIRFFTEACAFSRDEAEGGRRRVNADTSHMVAFKENKLGDVQKEAVDISKALDQKFASMEAIM